MPCSSALGQQPNVQRLHQMRRQKNSLRLLKGLSLAVSNNPIIRSAISSSKTTICPMLDVAMIRFLQINPVCTNPLMASQPRCVIQQAKGGTKTEELRKPARSDRLAPCTRSGRVAPRTKSGWEAPYRYRPTDTKWYPPASQAAFHAWQKAGPHPRSAPV